MLVTLILFLWSGVFNSKIESYEGMNDFPCDSLSSSLLRIRQRKYVEDEEALASSGAFTLSNPLVGVKDEGNI